MIQPHGICSEPQSQTNQHIQRPIVLLIAKTTNMKFKLLSIWTIGSLLAVQGFTTTSVPSVCRRQHVGSVVLHEGAASWRDALAWAEQETVESLIPKEDAVAIVSELINNDELTKESEELVLDYWKKLEKRLKDEKRSIGEILGTETVDTLLKSVKNINQYDSESVRAFLGSKAMNSLFAKVLYDGIFEFFQVIDVFGNIVNSLPIIGPIRKQIVAETRKQLDSSLGPLVQNFLQSYTKVAVGRAADFILSPSNQERFGNANVQVVKSLLQRPVSSLILAEGLLEAAIQDYYATFRDIDPAAIERYMDLVYDYVGDRSLSNTGINVERIVEGSPTLLKTVDRLWDQAIIKSAGASESTSTIIGDETDAED